jgi:hypothetical protein
MYLQCCVYAEGGGGGAQVKTTVRIGDHQMVVKLSGSVNLLGGSETGESFLLVKQRPPHVAGDVNTPSMAGYFGFSSSRMGMQLSGITLENRYVTQTSKFVFTLLKKNNSSQAHLHPPFLETECGLVSS